MAVPGQVTDPTRIEAGPTDYPDGQGWVTGYLARPRGKDRAPGLVVIHEAFGLNDHIKDLTRRFANAGFNALAVDLYARRGAPNPQDMQDVLTKMFALPDDEVVHHLEAAIQWMKTGPVQAPKVGVIGFCSGGRQTLLVACRSRAVDAACDCWGGFITRATPDRETTPERPVPVIDLVADLACPLFAVFGAEDQNPSPADADRLQAALIRHGKAATIKVFADAGHAFLADYRPSYREKAAFELWPQIVAFFERHLAPDA
ncbi:MAG: dienelactone hydrolase family protein [Firmicutes bacterium]|nr:dienelactone hydrolase family protein [Alicyclobacillaceae bacterium]MCL6496424.1 dienelactone hydrolase family protein [Bacillota bacterium]